MKQILKQVHFDEELTPEVVLNTLGHVGLSQTRNEPLSLTIFSYSMPSNPWAPQVSWVNVVWGGPEVEEYGG